MAVAVMPYMGIRTVAVPPKISLSFRLLRDGDDSPGEKRLRIYRDWDSVSKLDMVFSSPAGSGGYTQTQVFDLTTLIAQSDWLVAGLDLTPPKVTRAIYMRFSESASLLFNITGGDTSSGGEDASLEAFVRVEGLPVSREVVVMERPSDGQWRIAGYGLSAADGQVDLNLKVTDGLCYALCPDDYGFVFAPQLPVTIGQRIRPTVFRGWLYEVTESGVLPAVEPEWWSDALEGPQPLGTARARVVRYFVPQARGPIPLEVTNANP